MDDLSFDEIIYSFNFIGIAKVLTVRSIKSNEILWKNVIRSRDKI